jgi:hypothetical protein
MCGVFIGVGAVAHDDRPLVHAYGLWFYKNYVARLTMDDIFGMSVHSVENSFFWLKLRSVAP